MGVSHVWYTGIIRHATQTDYSKYGIPRQHPAVVKGKAGSPYAITDYYDVDPDLAVNVDERMQEFEQLVERTHAAGLKMVIDFVPNHVARQYHSVCKPQGVVDLGADDDPQQGLNRASIRRTTSTIARASALHRFSTSIRERKSHTLKSLPRLRVMTISIMHRRRPTGMRPSS